MEKILLIGGGGHCESVIDSIIENSSFDIVGVLDTPEKVGETIGGVPIIGVDEDLQKWRNKGIQNAFITLGSIGHTQLRQKLFQQAKKIGFSFPVIKDKTAIISNRTTINEGTFIGKGVIVNASVKIGKLAIINSGAIVEHGSTIGDYCHLAPGSTLSGNVSIGKSTHIGTNTTIIQGIEIGKETIIGAGSVVIRNIGSFKIAYGNPCKEATNE